MPPARRPASAVKPPVSSTSETTAGTPAPAREAPAKRAKPAAAASKTAAAKKPAAKNTPAAKKPAAVKKSAAAKKPAAVKKSTATKQPAAAGKKAGSASGRPKAAKVAKDAQAAAEERLDAAAVRLRKLNERIIEASKDAGETTLANYEKALKAIADGIERGPGSSDIEWVSSLATANAKFIRDVTKSIASAGRDLLT